ncbi:MAG: nucleotide-binding protein [Candidatus Latescibacterota bacterium]
MYSLLVSHQFHDWDGGAFRFDKSRFLEYTSEPIEEQLRPLSIEAIECIRSWPCVLMEEGRAEEIVRIARISELRDLGREIRLTVNLCPSKAPILNDHLWRIREELDIEQFEFSRNHWAVKERDLLSVLRHAGHEFDTSAIGLFESKPLPAPARASLISARNSISEWSHTNIDDLLLEAGVADLSAGRDVGSRRDRANAIVQFAMKNPSAVTAENSLFSAYLVRRSPATEGEVEEETPPALTQDVAPATGPGPEAGSADRSPNRVFVVHGQNDTARTAVVSFLESIGLVGIVLHEQPNMGRHLLTKFIQEADLVTFAVVLMTADDLGSLKGGKLAPRARQNVILELGYFLAHLGQAKVCALITPGLETPSDFDGIVYIRIDDEQRWQQELKRELLAARMPVVEAPSGASAD